MKPWRPQSVERAYAVLLDALRGGPFADSILTSHWPLVGTAPHRVLLVGQAVYGWVPSWRIDDLETAGGIGEIVDKTSSVFYDLDDPMEWVAGHSVRLSPFWRFARHLVELAYPDSTSEWYSHVAWANIYPVARNDVVGNPEGELRSRQTQPAARLLDAVASELQPDLVVVVGGTYWWDVHELLPFDERRDVARPLLTAGVRGGMRWVAGMHPAGAQRRGWKAQEYAQQVLSVSRDIT